MDAFEKYYNHALRFLSYRPRSEKEIRDNLGKKKVDPQVIEKIIAKLKEQKFINDKEFARMWVESRMRFKQRSIKLIIIELKQKGVDQEIIEDLVMSPKHPSSSEQAEFVIQSDLEQAKVLVDKKISKYKNLPKQEIYQKLGAFLARKGFDWSTIKKSIDEAIGKEV